MSRGLTQGEVELASSVFGEAIDYSKVRLSTRFWGVFAIAFGSHVTFPPTHPVPDDFAEEPVRLQAWLIHELVHVWQFQTRPWWTVKSWAGVVLNGGYGRGLPGYRYRVPLKPWAAHNLEQQASIVEHAFVMRETGRCGSAPAGATFAALRSASPFFA
jgi:hypothetical protein